MGTHEGSMMCTACTFPITDTGRLQLTYASAHLVGNNAIQNPASVGPQVLDSEPEARTSRRLVRLSLC